MTFYKETDFQDTPIGKIPKDWEVLKIGDLAQVRGRIGWKGLKASEYTREGPCLVANKHLVNNRVIWEKCDHLSEFRYNESPEIQLQINDVIISKDGTIGQPAYIESLPNRATLNSTMMLLRVQKNILAPAFLFYFLRGPHFRRFLKQKISGTSIPHLFQRDMKELTIPIPSLDEQKGVVEFLGVVDSALELVDWVIAKTERLKKGLMQQLLTLGIGPTEYKNTPIGKIPKTWHAMKLIDVAKIERGKFAHRPRNEPRFYGGNIPFIQTGDVAAAKGLIKNYTQTLNDQGLKISRMFKKGTIVISIAGNIGDVGILDFDACFPDSIIGITVHNDIDRFFLMYLLQHLQRDISAKAPRSTQKNINLDILKPMKIPIPPLAEQQKISAILSEVAMKLDLENREKTNLERIKQGLMDLLLAGKVRIKVD